MRTLAHTGRYAAAAPFSMGKFQSSGSNSRASRNSTHCLPSSVMSQLPYGTSIGAPDSS
jgi:hypothetical protein